MAEELQHLLETIQRDGVAKAEAEASRIEAEARDKADQLVAAARAEAEKIRAAADRDADSAAERGERALEQASRDVLISLGQAVEAVLKESVLGSVGEALAPRTLEKLLVSLTEGSLKGNGAQAELQLSPADVKALKAFFARRLRQQAKGGLEIHPADDISKGFRISLEGEAFYHDFTQEAIAEELCRYLGPDLREIVRRAVQAQQG